jgi:hypothetical protein
VHTRLSPRLSLPPLPDADGVTVTDVADVVDENESNPDLDPSVEQA